MAYEIRLSESYKKRLRKFIQSHKDMAVRYEKTLRILQENPYHPSLRLHKLKGNLSEYYSISINIEYRIIMDFMIVDEVIILLDIGAHDEVY
ncbi:type II toxin-antitoxin system RelE/ParE family toxin [Sulfurospirillum multivorans]|uniref:HigB toxin protein n=2 Tax=Sulfurospirillum multivorans TaxID=66821 RepID=A0AA86AQV9_SULMK|nr:type II toxin-antitoxin system mRNA interferase toxin, RelE/StbE family [Sulfurospirillum multivorans]AHJ14053.1 HigB toxin protein [Sulfurospirillum multivorans DSM 12446]QEH07540.1 HigB toxin protein [Sulfurospirillum multivorans]